MRRCAALAALAVVAAPLLAACSSHPAARPGEARRFVVAVPSPGSGWTPGGAGLHVGFDPLDLHRVDGIWVAHAHRRTPTYLTTWQVRVLPGQETRRCTEAAAWLARTGRELPGTTRTTSAHGLRPTRSLTVTQCLESLDHAGLDQGFSDDFASWPNTTSGGYAFGPYLTAFGSGAHHRVLAASAQAAPRPD